MELKVGSRGSLVSFFQTILNSLNLYKEATSNNIDGIFGTLTQNAVKAFQSKFNLKVTGVIDDIFVQEILPYVYVPTNISYTSEIVDIILQAFKYKYNFLTLETIGKSVLDSKIQSIKIGSGSTHVLYVASTHANEWITTPLALKFVEDYSNAYMTGENIYDKSSIELFNKCTIHIVPLLNPDGVDLVNNNIDKSTDAYINVLEISNNYPSIKFPSGWKANIQGIDLNLQFPAMWDEAKKIKFNQGYISPAPRDFVGMYPLQAPEASAIYDYTIINNFSLMLTFHTQGEVIFWKYLDFMPPKAEQIGEVLSNASGYSLQDTPYASSFAGFKDWFIQAYNLPGYTIEAGLGTNPLPISDFDKIYNDCIGIFVLAAFYAN